MLTATPHSQSHPQIQSDHCGRSNDIFHRNRVTIWSSHPTPGHISKKGGHSHSKRSQPSVRSSTVYNSRDTEGLYVSIKTWMEREDVANTHTLSRKEQEIVPFAATRADLEIILLSEVSQRRVSLSLTCEILKNDAKKFIYKRNSDIENNLMLPKGKG